MKASSIQINVYKSEKEPFQRIDKTQMETKDQFSSYEIDPCNILVWVRDY